MTAATITDMALNNFTLITVTEPSRFSLLLGALTPPLLHRALLI
ncbi:hypothetical protein [Phragmitibacter flavus]|nr:hypothetical protein [Phragmitibacter flavus]